MIILNRMAIYPDMIACLHSDNLTNGFIAQRLLHIKETRLSSRWAFLLRIQSRRLKGIMQGLATSLRRGLGDRPLRHKVWVGINLLADLG